VGQLVTVELRVSARQESHQVAIVDRLPAGLEAVDLLLSTSVGTETDEASSHDVYWAHQESHDERVSFFTDHLSGGSHVVRYVARATRRGHFVHPPARVEAMYQGDRHGIGTLDSIRVE
jgi:uncharacterized protein YfaS (alpha-2-macroglobulin family)